jgi:predicted ribosomally synthesized peptide with nif11-like leader
LLRRIHSLCGGAARSQINSTIRIIRPAADGRRPIIIHPHHTASRMSIAAAIAFSRAVRADPALAEQVRALGADAALEDVAALARAAGHDCTADDLREAHRRDWTLRWLAHAAADAAPNRDSSTRASAK